MGGQLVRFVFHLDQSQEDIAKLCETLEEIKL
jgi:threonine aldolase